MVADASARLQRYGHDAEMDAGAVLQIAAAAAVDVHALYPPSVMAAFAALDQQLNYRMSDTERPLRWIGAGCNELGIEAGSELPGEQFDIARAVMKGQDPRSGEQLVRPKTAAHPGSKLMAGPLLEAIRDRAAALGHDPLDLVRSQRQRSSLERMSRQVRLYGDTHRVRVSALLTLGDAAGVDVVALYGRPALERALALEHDRVVAGNRGYDLTINLPKAFSVLYAFARGELADEVEQIFVDCLDEAVTAAERWTCYGMRGHHGDGAKAARVAGSGFIGWVNIHRTARPTGSAPVGDPHLHAHVTIANMCRGADGQWSTIAAGGRDLFRHILAIDALMQARIRQVTHERWGMIWQRNTHTGVWQIVGIPEETIRLFSKRNTEILALFKQWGIDITTCTATQQHTAAEVLKNAKTQHATLTPTEGLRAYWRAEARAAGQDPDAIVAATMTPLELIGRQPVVQASGPADLDALCRWLFRPDEGLTAHRKDFTGAQALAAVIDAIQGGIASCAEAEELTDLALKHGGYAIQLATTGPTHLTHSDRYTTADIIAAERAIIAAVRRRYRSGCAVLAPATLQMAIDTYQATHQLTLSPEQRTVLERLASAGHGVDAVIGVAGAGKTTLMEVARIAWEAEGKVIAGTSTAAVACANLRLETGIPAFTIAKWLERIERGRGLAGVDVLIVDESAMVDDRQLAVLLAHAAEVGTKVVGIGDPAQLQSPGVGGSFNAVHTLIGGLTLSTNYRQQDVVERRALEIWRTGNRREALRTWAQHGRVHATTTREQALAHMLMMWDERRRLYPDVHEAITEVLMLAGKNTDVDELNLSARAIRRAAGELAGPDTVFALADGGALALTVGDIVLIRKNQYREWRSNGRHADVLNGFRGIVTAVDRQRGVQVQWRRTDTDGRIQHIREWVSAAYIAEGGLSYGMAMTVHKTQGLGADYALTYGPGLHTNATYTALSRDIREAHLFLARTALEDEDRQATLGRPRSPAEEFDRALNAFADSLEYDHDEGLILAELGEQIEPIDLVASGETDPIQRVGDRIYLPDPLAEAVRRALGPWAAVVTVNEQWPVLARILARAAEAGHDVDALVAAAAAEGPLNGARSLPRALAWRIQRHLNGDAAPPRRVQSGAFALPVLDAAARAALAHLPGVMVGSPHPGAVAALDDFQRALPPLPKASELAVTPWQERLFGLLTDAELRTQIRDVTAGLPILQRAAAQADALASNLHDSAASRSGPAVSAVLRAHETLRAHAVAIEELAEVEAELEAQLITERQMRERLGQLTRRGTTNEATRLKEQIAASGSRIAQLTSRRSALRQAAGPASGHESVQRRLQRRIEQHEQLLNRAHATDIQDAAKASQDAELLNHQAQELTFVLRHLTAEAALRQSLDKEESAREVAQRRTHQRDRGSDPSSAAAALGVPAGGSVSAESLTVSKAKQSSVEGGYR
ncbi:conjugal transfer protein TraA [Sphaerisporangium album]|uniref:Conjugal transfer protein TraA n=1 Tax=Sphaerisporangium album TaxID=509200 RepID=A0A367ET03_9ACTN|nr:conjugal transfer protein TraA [Sphaerisporangium album]